MRVSISTLTGVEVARLETDATVTLLELLALLPNEVDDIECSRRIFFGETELKGDMNLSDIGVKEDSVLTVVFGSIQQVLILRPDRKGVVGCLRGVPAHLERSQPLGLFCSLLARRPAGADRVPRRDREGVVGCLRGVPAHLERSQPLGLFCSLLGRLPAGADRILRPDREGVVGSLGRMPGHLERSQHWVYSAVFSADDQQVLTASRDGTAKVWSAASGECLRHFEAVTQALSILQSSLSAVDDVVSSTSGRRWSVCLRAAHREGSKDQWAFITRRIRASWQLALKKCYFQVVAFIMFPAMYCVC